jgi:exopolyphosphatase/pppGpp-phosphohydrolase
MLEAGSTLGYEEETLTRSAVHAVCERLFLRGAFSTKDFPDTPTERHAVFLACAAICDVLLDVLGTPTLMVCKSGLRAGLLQHLFVRSQWSQLAQ